MEKNYYEILEVDKKASTEIIEKAYKTLVKKYHPDLQKESSKEQFEEKLKIINEAYDTLSDPIKRESYNAKIEKNNISEEDYNAIYSENQFLKDKLQHMQYKENLKNNYIYNYSYFKQPQQTYYENNQKTQKNYYEPEHQSKYSEEELNYMKNIEQARQKAYYDAYIQDLKNRGYKIKYQKTFKDYLKSFISILLTLAILWMLFQLPFVKNFLQNYFII